MSMPRVRTAKRAHEVEAYQAPAKRAAAAIAIDLCAIPFAAGLSMKAPAPRHSSETGESGESCDDAESQPDTPRASAAAERTDIFTPTKASATRGGRAATQIPLDSPRAWSHGSPASAWSPLSPFTPMSSVAPRGCARLFFAMPPRAVPWPLPSHVRALGSALAFAGNAFTFAGALFPPSGGLLADPAPVAAAGGGSLGQCYADELRHELTAALTSLAQPGMAPPPSLGGALMDQR
ncbi:hypothetical protein FOA52_009568 [Chlamydomonas sp. UWO 241]|nr:hypothetical protein FOA52_009568 [Chlamydomonas sp. UWO 241]